MAERTNLPAKESALRDRAVERSLLKVRARAVDRSNRFIQTGLKLFAERGLNFTVEDVVRESQTSLRSFYQYFETKTELLLAMFEEIMARSGMLIQERVSAVGGTPEQRLQAFITGLCESISDPTDERPLVLHHLYLAETRPTEYAHVLLPMLEALEALIAEGIDSGDFRDDFSPRNLAAIVLHTVVSFVHTEVLGAYLTDPAATAKDIYTLCLTGIINEDKQLRPGPEILAPTGISPGIA